ncbi:MAG TPA: hypothetical protein DCF68_00960 [Cyanothece sp. UBA12306]|nr:hypothetical protein [Cyanothece sp. UBA12306]
MQPNECQVTEFMDTNQRVKAKKLYFDGFLNSSSIKSEKSALTEPVAELDEAVGLGPFWSEYDMWI